MCVMCAAKAFHVPVASTATNWFIQIFVFVKNFDSIFELDCASPTHNLNLLCFWRSEVQQGVTFHDFVNFQAYRKIVVNFIGYSISNFV